VHFLSCVQVPDPQHALRAGLIAGVSACLYVVVLVSLAKWPGSEALLFAIHHPQSESNHRCQHDCHKQYDEHFDSLFSVRARVSVTRARDWSVGRCQISRPALRRVKTPDALAVFAPELCAATARI
jgi:hypothetical protein